MVFRRKRVLVHLRRPEPVDPMLRQKKRNPRKRNPRERNPRNWSPRKRSPRKRSPRKRSPKKRSPRERSLRERSPKRKSLRRTNLGRKRRRRLVWGHGVPGFWDIPYGATATEIMPRTSKNISEPGYHFVNSVPIHRAEAKKDEGLPVGRPRTIFSRSKKTWSSPYLGFHFTTIWVAVICFIYSEQTNPKTNSLT